MLMVAARNQISTVVVLPSEPHSHLHTHPGARSSLLEMPMGTFDPFACNRKPSFRSYFGLWRRLVA